MTPYKTPHKSRHVHIGNPCTPNLTPVKLSFPPRNNLKNPIHFSLNTKPQTNYLEKTKSRLQETAHARSVLESDPKLSSWQLKYSLSNPLKTSLKTTQRKIVSFRHPKQNPWQLPADPYLRPKEDSKKQPIQ